MERVTWAEVHPSREDQVKVVLKKLAWLKNWLGGDGHLLGAFERRYVWVSSGKTAISANALIRKKLSSEGLVLSGASCNLD